MYIVRQPLGIEKREHLFIAFVNFSYASGIGAILWTIMSNSLANSFHLAVLKLKRRRKDVLCGLIVARIWQPIGRCWLLGIGSEAIFDFGESLTKRISGLYRFLHRPVLKEGGNFLSWMRVSLLLSPQVSTASPFSSSISYSQTLLWLLKSPMTSWVFWL